MPLLDIAIAHSSVQKHLCYTRVQLFINGNTPNYSSLKHEERWTSFRKSLHYNRNLNFGLVHFKKSCPGFLVSAVATIEPKSLVQNKHRETEINAFSSTESESKSVETESSSEDSEEEIDDREKLRRFRISQANKGNTPWNKGRKHSPETLQRIRERTRLAMQSPKVKLKLASLGHAQSNETRIKIAVGVRIGWQKRREKLMLQETCLFDWQNLNAEAARGGFQDEEELQWDSYGILSKQLHQEWLDSIQYRKSVPRTKGSKRAPKSLEQRKKIAEAIAAKWADPEYRTRVCSGLAKYHKIPEGAERAKRKPRGEGSSRKIGDAGRRTAKNLNGRIQPPKLKKRNVPKYKDPLATTKLEMLKSIRAQRGGSDTKKIEALERAKLLIAEAQKAAKALEVAAMRSPVARASLIEAQKLIEEATQSIKSIENGELSPQDDPKSPDQDYVENSGESLGEDNDQRYHITVNGIREAATTNADQRYPKSVNGVESLQFGDTRKLETNLHKLPKKLDFAENTDSIEVIERMDEKQPDTNGSMGLNGISSVNGVKLQSHEDQHPDNKTVTKKWVRGRLVEFAEGE